MSRGRAESITSHELFPEATLVVPETESADYEHLGLQMVTIPDEIKGIGPVRNWILDNFEEKALVMVDDDIKHVWVCSRKRGYKITDPDIVAGIVYSAAVCANDLGTACFGFNQTWDVRKYKAYEPFNLSGWFGGVFGVIGRDIRFCSNMFKADVDYCLETLYQKRVLWMDDRFSFVQERDKNLGGNSLFRTKGAVDADIARLKRKWQKHYTYRETKTGASTRINVPRRQLIRG